MNIRFFIILFLTLVTLCSCEGSPKSEQISSFWNWYNTTVAADSSFSESVEMSQFDRVEIRDLPGKGLSVFAKVDISKGEPAIKIPSRMAMGMNDVHAVLGMVYIDQVPTEVTSLSLDEKMAFFILIQKFYDYTPGLGPRRWAHWADSLPLHIETALSISVEDLEVLRGTGSIHFFIDRRKIFRLQVEHVYVVARELGLQITVHDAEWAVFVVQSRTYNPTNLGLYPLLEFVNHDRHANSEILTSFRNSLDENAVEYGFKAARDIKKGEEITTTYTYGSIAHTFAQYGFFDEDAPAITFSLDLNQMRKRRDARIAAGAANVDSDVVFEKRVKALEALGCNQSYAKYLERQGFSFHHALIACARLYHAKPEEVLDIAIASPVDPLADKPSEKLACEFLFGYVDDHLGKIQRSDDVLKRHLETSKEAKSQSSSSSSNIRELLLKLREAERTELLKVKAFYDVECAQFNTSKKDEL